MPDDAFPTELLPGGSRVPPLGQDLGTARPALDRLARIAALGLGAAAVEIRLDLPDGRRMTGATATSLGRRVLARPLIATNGRAFGEIRIGGAGPASANTDDLLGEIGEMALHEHRLCQMVRTDALTGAATRTALLDALRDLAKSGGGRQLPLSLLMLDIDRFKQVNDRHGHQAGDIVLGAVAARIRTRLRRSDLFARIGGEEFCIALPATPHRSAWRVATRLRKAIATDPVELPDGQVDVTVSVGIATTTRAAPEQAMVDADRALYEAKRAGRNRVWPALTPAARMGRAEGGSLSRV